MKLVLLTGLGDSSRILAAALAKAGFENMEVYCEKGVPRLQMLKARAKRLGWAAVAGQILFMLFILPILKWRGRARRKEIMEQYNLVAQWPAGVPVTKVDTINAQAIAEILQKAAPDAVIINGTRILKPYILSAVAAQYINIHAGITPRYRGVHGGYWALYQGEPEHCGTTVHLVDSGVDTGPVVLQVRITPCSQDNFTTYPLLQQAAALSPLIEILRRQPKVSALPQQETPTADSRQWYHPTLFQYLKGRIRGVK